MQMVLGWALMTSDTPKLSTPASAECPGVLLRPPELSLDLKS